MEEIKAFGYANSTALIALLAVGLAAAIYFMVFYRRKKKP